MRPPCRRREHRWHVAAQAALSAEPYKSSKDNWATSTEPLRSRSLRLAKYPPALIDSVEGAIDAYLHQRSRGFVLVVVQF